MTQRARNLLSAIVLLIAGVYWFIEARGYPPLSRLYPQVLAGIIVVLSLLLGGLTLAGFGPVIRLARGDAAERHLRSGMLMTSLIVWTLLIPLGGLLIASLIGVVTMGFLTFRAQKGTIRGIVIAVVVVLGFYFLFQEVLNVYFSFGLLG